MLYQLLPPMAAEYRLKAGTNPGLGSGGWAGVQLGSSPVFLRDGRTHLWEEWTRAGDTVKVSWLGLEANMPRLVG